MMCRRRERAELNIRLGRHQRALTDLDAVAAVAADDPELPKLRARLLFKLGQVRGGVRCQVFCTVCHAIFAVLYVAVLYSAVLCCVVVCCSGMYRAYCTVVT